MIIIRNFNLELHTDVENRLQLIYINYRHVTAIPEISNDCKHVQLDISSIFFFLIGLIYPGKYLQRN